MNNQRNTVLRHRRLTMGLGALIAAGATVGALIPQMSASADQEHFLMQDYMQWNVVTLGDAHLSAESEGAVAVGGTLSFHNSNTATQQSARSGGSGVGLLANNVDFSNSAAQLKVLSGSIRIGDAAQSDVLNRDGNNAQMHTRVVSKGAGPSGDPSIVANNSMEGSEQVTSPTLFSSLFSKSSAERLAQQIAVYPQTDTHGVQASVSISGTKAVIALTEGKTNYWPVDAGTLAGITELSFSGASPNVDAGTFLVVPISGSAVTFNLTLAGARDPGAMLWVAPEANSIVQSGDSLDGSILAPKAHLDKRAANIQGTIVVNSGTFMGSEQHYFPYKGKVPPVVPTDPVTPVITTTPATPTETPSTPTETPSTPTSPATTPTDSNTPTHSETTTTTTPATALTTTTTTPAASASSNKSKAGTLAQTGGSGAVLGAGAVMMVFVALGMGVIAFNRSRGHSSDR
ncbi:collagen-binding domain-containing protein [Bifidobacterium crudilactis]|uniref:collagen-binding domain-containing protein n=1 Tax=Bifidobacterium crudilactis TaxID=327277 RepID=UPI00138DE886|nr:collagen-binding domain-containing protein [Bifidobacterium crudilactis]MCI2148008.1 choice-of-anchor A family protein [Bifidobacterium crudilactis]MCI2158464.1 choice-of-anchor A family protein [Bifidobacterium crudilactis]